MKKKASKNTQKARSRAAHGSAFTFVIGRTYKTQAGKRVKVIGRTRLKGYECLRCSDGRYRYDRSTTKSDAGRVTGTAHDYSCPHNFERLNSKVSDGGGQ